MPRRDEREEKRLASPEYKKAAAQVENSLRKQQTPYDKLWYTLLYEAYTAAANAHAKGLKHQEEEKLRQAGLDPDDEANSIPENEYDKEAVMSGDLSTFVGESVKNELWKFSTVEEQRQFYQQLGAINAKASYEAGKEYQRWLDSDLLKDDPNKEAKAEYLTRNARSKAQYLMLGCNALQFSMFSDLQNRWHGNIDDSFLADRNAFRKMTMREFCERAYMSEEQMQEYMRDLAEQGHKVDLDSNAYALFQDVRSKKDGTPKEKLGEDEVLSEAFSAYQLKMSTNYQTLGVNIVRNNLPPEEREIFDRGVQINNMIEYKPPKSIKEWAENEGKAFVEASEAEEIKKAADSLKIDVDVKESLEVTKTGPLSYALGRQKGQVKTYQEYVNEHLGMDALNLSFEEQREHLAKAMAADALQDSRIHFHEGTIEDMAKDYLEQDEFKRLSNREVGELLAGGASKLRKFRRELEKDTIEREEDGPETETPEGPAQSMEELQKDLAKQERTVAELTEKKQSAEIYLQNQDKMVEQAKKYLDTLRKLGKQRKENSDEFQNMERALENVSKINKNMSPRQVDALMTQLGATADAYRERIDGSWFKGILGNGQDRRNLSETLGYFANSQKGALRTLRKDALSPDSGINRQMMALDGRLEEAKQKVKTGKEELESAKALEVAQKAEAKEVMENSFHKVIQVMDKEEAYRRGLNPSAADYQEKLMQSAERSLFLQTTVDACQRNVGQLGEKKSAQIMSSTMDKMLKAKNGNSMAFRAFKAEHLSQQVFNEHYTKQVMKNAKQGKLSEEDMIACRDEALKASFADRRADVKALNQLSATFGSGVNSKSLGLKLPKEGKTVDKSKTSEKSKTKDESKSRAL